eukprot:COSAG06_NODE_42002_length_385_cov_1.786713_2_plen_62_part_01
MIDKHRAARDARRITNPSRHHQPAVYPQHCNTISLLSVDTDRGIFGVKSVAALESACPRAIL